MSHKSDVDIHLIGQELTGFQVSNSELILEFGDKVLIIEGGYSKNVYFELKRKVTSYEELY